jgi:hypothetical protein
MKPDPVISEIRRVREAYAERFAGDIRAMLADLHCRQQESGRVTVSRPPKQAKQSPTR